MASLTLVICTPEPFTSVSGELAELGFGLVVVEVELLEVEDCGLPMENEQAAAIKTRGKPTNVKRALRTEGSSMSDET